MTVTHDTEITASLRCTTYAWNTCARRFWIQTRGANRRDFDMDRLIELLNCNFWFNQRPPKDWRQHGSWWMWVRQTDDSGAIIVHRSTDLELVQGTTSQNIIRPQIVCHIHEEIWRGGQMWGHVFIKITEMLLHFWRTR